MFLFRFANELDRLKKDSIAALSTLQSDKDNKPEDPIQYWIKVRCLCSTKSADLASSSVPSKRLAGVMCAGLIIISLVSQFQLFILGKKHSLSDENLERRVLLKCNLEGLKD